jgi:hypothetical protein
MFRGAIIAVVCLAVGGFFGYQFAMNDINKMVVDAQRKSK